MIVLKRGTPLMLYNGSGTPIITTSTIEVKFDNKDVSFNMLLTKCKHRFHKPLPLYANTPIYSMEWFIK